MTEEKTARIRALNDQLRASGQGGLVLVTRGLLEFGFPFAAQVRAAIARETNFPADNDPYDEHDFGAIDIEGNRVLWKIDYYDLDRRHASDDPSDPKITQRVMTIMLADEY
ncbi:DUF3768 domain-containing protein [Brevundimonas sp. BT-123]|uniref:DUF3768 domain-containing protein n=1 Tax=Brevundimonas sp. BT-123 TaxID=2986928 RepID=UPI00223683AB|nr:DUF3768 domain-containing protein [Brevundimonas sp. BT-123]MCW0044931.1 DUF3768 domain-containing protein [Brevundimonas sp. BT-123]